MLDLNKLKAVQTIVVHENCADGLASAILLKDAFYGKTVEIVFLQHNTEEHKAFAVRPNTLFADFIPYAETAEVPVPHGRPKRMLTETGRATVQAWIDAGAMVLDHHKTARDSGLIDMFLEAGLAVFGDEKTQPGICGATLAYEHVWKPFRGDLAVQEQFAREFARIAGIRDTWQKASPDFRESSLQMQVLTFYPREHWMSMGLTALAARWRSDFRPIGEVLMTRQERAVQKVSENAFRLTTAKGTRIAAFDALRHSSDVAEALGKEADLVIGFTVSSDRNPETGEQTPKLILSTRSHTGYDCSALASRYGGGGHSAAAGFNHVLLSTDPQPFEMIRRLVEAYEA